MLGRYVKAERLTPSHPQTFCQKPVQSVIIKSGQSVAIKTAADRQRQPLKKKKKKKTKHIFMFYVVFCLLNKTISAHAQQIPIPKIASRLLPKKFQILSSTVYLKSHDFSTGNNSNHLRKLCETRLFCTYTIPPA